LHLFPVRRYAAAIGRLLMRKLMRDHEAKVRPGPVIILCVHKASRSTAEQAAIRPAGPLPQDVTGSAGLTVPDR
jgi:hypothetical protein